MSIPKQARKIQTAAGTVHWLAGKSFTQIWDQSGTKQVVPNTKVHGFESYVYDKRKLHFITPVMIKDYLELGPATKPHYEKKFDKEIYLSEYITNDELDSPL